MELHFHTSVEQKKTLEIKCRFLKILKVMFNLYVRQMEAI